MESSPPSQPSTAPARAHQHPLVAIGYWGTPVRLTLVCGYPSRVLRESNQSPGPSDSALATAGSADDTPRSCTAGSADVTMRSCTAAVPTSLRVRLRVSALQAELTSLRGKPLETVITSVHVHALQTVMTPRRVSARSADVSTEDGASLVKASS
ncbi:hypothetical protein NDU88_000444 [Pleurodeles waltl]|uniref:Uncharacterized protein n=1 Tax=Pleurodeles waltl TaxID=8319 RepID=A0AAV7LUV2_PLEWA|nr:hypothetical protein NDU88_000444 [Pleurodeles waltl]